MVAPVISFLSFYFPIFLNGDKCRLALIHTSLFLTCEICIFFRESLFVEEYKEKKQKLRAWKN